MWNHEKDREWLKNNGFNLKDSQKFNEVWEIFKCNDKIRLHVLVPHSENWGAYATLRLDIGEIFPEMISSDRGTVEDVVAEMLERFKKLKETVAALEID